MHFLLCLLLGHFIGDFPLQTDAVYRLKTEKFAGTLFHAAIVTAVTGLLVFPYGAKAVIGAVILGILHAVLDWQKVKQSDVKGGQGQLLFFLDQALHLALIFGLAALLGFPGRPPEAETGMLSWYYRTDIMTAAVIYTLTMFFGAVWVQLTAYGLTSSAGGVEARGGQWLTCSERWLGVLERALITTGVWGGYLSLVLAGLIVTAFAYGFFWKDWMGRPFFAVRTLISVVLAMVLGIVLKFTV